MLRAVFCISPLVLAGCLGLDHRPLDDFLRDYEQFDTGTLDTGTLGTDGVTDPPLFTPTLCSVDGGSAVSVTVVNTSGRNADLYWSPASCQPVFTVAIAANASTPLNTFIGHAFWLAIGGRMVWLDEMQIEEGVDTYEVGVPE